MNYHVKLCTFALSMLTAIALSVTVRADESPKPPKVGDKIKEYKFHSDTRHEVSLAALARKGPLVLIVLRGFPGYQCPACSAQVVALRKHAKEFKELAANVVLVYPGAVDDLQLRANQFLADAKLPEPLVLVLDKNYDFIRTVGLRWDQKGETAYPSTFVLDKNRVVRFAKISRTHGDRAKPDAVLAAVRAVAAAQPKGVTAKAKPTP